LVFAADYFGPLVAGRIFGEKVWSEGWVGMCNHLPTCFSDCRSIRDL